MDKNVGIAATFFTMLGVISVFNLVKSTFKGAGFDRAMQY